MTERAYLVLEGGKSTTTLLDIDKKGGFIENRIIVKSASDLVDIDSSKLYVIDGSIDMGTQQIEVPSGGFFARGLGFNVSFVFSSEDNYTLFVNKPGQDAGDIRIRDIEVSCSGANSQIFNIDNGGNFSAVELEGFNLGSFSNQTPSLGSISNYRQFRLNNSAVINVADGLEFIGSFAGGLLISETILLNIPNNTTLFKKGAGLLFDGSVVSSINALSVGSNVTVFDFESSNFSLDWGFSLSGARFKLNTNPVPNIPENSTKRFFQNCRGVANTRVGAGWKIDTASTTTLSVNTPKKINANTLYDSVIHFTTANNNEFVYNSEVEEDFFISGYIVMDGGPNDELRLIVRKFDFVLSSYVDVEDYVRNVSNVAGALDLALFNIGTPVRLKKGDRIELWIENTTDGTNVAIQQGSYCRVKREA